LRKTHRLHELLNQNLANARRLNRDHFSDN
jgi:hypothetical protein